MRHGPYGMGWQMLLGRGGVHMPISPHLLIIGAAGMDVKGRAHKALQLGTSVPGEITVSLGGVGRNVAENLAENLAQQQRVTRQ